MTSERFSALNITSEQNSDSFWKMYSCTNFILHDSVEVSRIHVTSWSVTLHLREMGQGCCHYDCKQLAKLSEINREKTLEKAE